MKKAIPLLFVLVVNNLFAQMDAFYKTDSVLQKKGYFYALDWLKQNYMLHEQTENSIEYSLIAQAYMTYYSFEMNTDSSVFYEYKTHNYPMQNTKSFDNTQTQIIDAKDYILNNFGNVEFLFFNEKHNRAQIRAFLKDMLPELYRQGFTTIALEDLKESTASLLKRGYPTLTTGFYIREPVFAQLIREALSIGFNFLNYDAPKSQNKFEERAKNIIKYKETNPNEKIIILGGHGAIYKERTDVPLNQPMPSGVYLCRKYGPSKLASIDCITFLETDSKGKENSFYTYLNDTVKIKSPVVVLENSLPIIGELLTHKMIDVSIFFPRTKNKYGIPNWAIQGNKLTEIPLPLEKRDQVQYLQVYYMNEFKKSKKKAIPIYQLVIDNNIHDKIELMLSNGSYSFIYLDGSFNCVNENTIEIK